MTRRPVALTTESFLELTVVNSMPKTILQRLQDIRTSMLQDLPIHTMGMVDSLIEDVQKTPHLPEFLVRPVACGDETCNVPLADCVTPGCKWVGPIKDAKHKGFLGPYCPQCNKISLVLRKKNDD